MIQAVRLFFVERGFLEVETPVRIPGPIPEAHIDIVPSEGSVLQPSPELCMKRLLAAGFERIFQICRCFRKGERGQRHLPEFTMLEWYRLGADYRALMTDCEDLFAAVARTMGEGNPVRFAGQHVDLSSPWEKITVSEAFCRYAPMPLEEALARDCFEEILVACVEPRLGVPKPVFLLDYPASLGSLARLKLSDPRWAERVELYAAGMELANGFSELTDAQEQQRRFEEENAVRRKLGKDVYPLPAPFLSDLERLQGIQAAGIALGIDRMAMLFTGRTRIDDVVAFVPEEL